MQTRKYQTSSGSPPRSTAVFSHLMNRKRSTEALNRPSVDAYASLSKLPIYVVLDNVRSAQNVGSFFRTMDAFRCEALYLCGITPAPPHREINKTALGATATVRHAHFRNTADCLDGLLELDAAVYAVEQTEHSTGLENFQAPQGRPLALVFGNEVDGVDQEIINRCEGSIEIPQFGTKHSLNIAVCGGIILWQLAGLKLSRTV